MQSENAPYLGASLKLRLGCVKMVRGDSVICKVACIHKPHFELGYLGVLLNVPWERSVYKKESSGSFFISFFSPSLPHLVYC